MQLCTAPALFLLLLLCDAPLRAQDAKLGSAPPDAQNPGVTESERKALVAALEALKAEDVPALVRDAEAGNYKAQWMLGVVYADGKLVPKDLVKSWSWFQKSAEKGWPIGQNAVGLAYMTGRGIERNPAEAVSCFRKAAEQGYAQGQARLGMAYFLGAGVSRDASEGVTWFRKAAEQENALGQFWFGNSYAQGQGVAKDISQAVVWFRKAADQGEPVAEYQMGRLYEKGEGLQQDRAESARWYRKAADHDYPAAQFDLAISYHEGQGVPRSMDEAEKWLSKASDAAWAPASYFLGRMYADKKFQTGPMSGEIALKYFEKSAEQGYPLGAYVLEDIYSNRFVAYHLWISRDDAKACHWFLVARELSKTDRWRSQTPGDSETVKQELPKQIAKIQKKLKDGLGACENSAQQWMKAHSENMLQN